MRISVGRSFAFAGVLAVLAAAPASAVDIQAGPIFSNMDAQNKCPGVCQRSNGRTWDGNWRTTEPGRMSVCSGGGQAGQRQSPVIGAGSSCSARGRGGCSGC